VHSDRRGSGILRLLQRLVRGPKVQRALNWIRRKRGKEPFVF